MYGEWCHPGDFKLFLRSILGNSCVLCTLDCRVTSQAWQKTLTGVQPTSRLAEYRVSVPKLFLFIFFATCGFPFCTAPSDFKYDCTLSSRFVEKRDNYAILKTKSLYKKSLSAASSTVSQMSSV